MGNAKKILLLILLVALTINCAEAKTDTAISMRLRLRTTSDWTLLHVSGCGDIKLSNYTNKSHYNIIVNPEPDKVSIWIGKPQYDDNLTEVTLDIVAVNPDDLTINITKGYIGVTSLKVSAWTGERYREVTRISHRNTVGDQSHNQYTKTINIEDLKPYSISLIESQSTHSEVLAIYYPWYGELNSLNLGRHWGRVSVDDIEESLNYPLMGTYDSRNSSVIAEHIKQASIHGITCFAVSWWGKYSYEDQVFEKILANCSGFKTCVYYETNRGASRSPEAIVDELNYIITKYGYVDGYLRYHDAPVIMVFNADGEGRDVDFWRSIRDETLDCVLVGDFRDPALVSVFDGVHIYNELDIDAHREVTELISTLNLILPESIRELNQKSRCGFIICESRLTIGTVSPGYDDTKIRPNGSVIPRLGNATYQAYWDNVMDYPLDWVLITSWNEWHEGTEIEPSRENGFDAIRYTKEMIEEWIQR